MKWLSNESLTALISAARASGRAIIHSVSHYEWDVSGSCSSPRPVELRSRPYGDMLGRMIRPGERYGYTMLMHVRCRSCDQCRALKAQDWRNRARYEWLRAPRTWFGTFTVAPENRVMFTNQARLYVSRSVERKALIDDPQTDPLVRSDLSTPGEDFDLLPAEQQFRMLERQIYRELSKYFDRLRKAADTRFSYLLVCEEHKDGFPHHHVLIHELDSFAPLRKKLLQDQWSHGFTAFTLAKTEREALYLTKYLTKATRARVRASKRYGKVQ